MTHSESHHLCGCCGISRRDFLTGCAGCLGAAGALSQLIVPSGFAEETAAAGDQMTVRVIFMLFAPVQPLVTMDWPGYGFDFSPVMEQTMNALKNGCAEIHFVASMANGPEKVQEIIEADNISGNVDGYIVMQMNTWPGGIQDAVNSGKPVLYADFNFGGSGGFLRSTAGIVRAGNPNFAFMSSGRVAEVVAAANCFPLVKKPGGLQAFVDGVKKVRLDAVAAVNEDMKCLEDKLDLLSIDELRKELKTQKMLELEHGWVDWIPEIRESLGIEIIRRPFSELHDLWLKADKDQAQEIADRWKQTAVAVVDVSDETLLNSAMMYLAMKQQLKMHDATAVTINCLGGFESILKGYPCLGFLELMDEGLIGACECDTVSTLTMMIITTMTKGRPGFISDPVMDVAAKQIIYAHCVAASKAFGPQGPASSYDIATHCIDRAGASVRVTLPVGYMTTSLQIRPDTKQVLFHQGKAVATSDDDKGCRTKLACVPVGDYEKLLTMAWDHWGWHRATFYGDLKEPVFALADALGWKVVEEA